MKRPLFTACLAACFGVAMLFAANTEAGFYKTITIDTDYSDWADVPVLDDDSGDNFGGPDIGITKIANDDDFLYIYNTFPNGLQLSTFTALDVDSDTATGFDVFELGLIGSEAGWQNDFAFTQDIGLFNNGSGMSGGPLGSGHALLDAFGNSGARELSISLDILFNAGGSVFADAVFDLLFWTDAGTGADMIPNGGAGDSGLNGDVSAPISYTLAPSPVPEPTSLLLCVAMGVGCLAARRRV